MEKINGLIPRITSEKIRRGIYFGQDCSSVTSKHYFSKKLKLALLFALGIGLVAYLPWKLYTWKGWVPALASLAALLLILWYLYHQIGIVGAGARGEKETLQLLRRGLNKNFWVLPDRVLQYGSHTSQVDYLILCPQKLVLLECKNVSGKIEGKGSDQYLSQRKTRSGRVYEEKKLYNPLLQVSGHAKTLQNICRELQIDLPIETAVYFSNPNVQVNINTNRKIFTVHDTEKLFTYLQGMDKVEKPNGWRRSFCSKLHKR